MNATASGVGGVEDASPVALATAGGHVVPDRLPRADAPPPAPSTWTWDTILGRCREVARAESVVAIDVEGNVIGAVGPLDATQVARIAAHVSMSFDLLDRLKYVGRLAECLCVQYHPEGSWLTAVRVAPRVHSLVTVAVVGRFTLVHRDRERLRNTFIELLKATQRAA